MRPPPVFLLDLTRLASRAGHPVDTGIDRVERAYLDRLMARPGPVFGLIRTRLGYLLLNRGGLAATAPRLCKPAQGIPPSALTRLIGPNRQRRLRRALALGMLRWRALARCHPRGLGRMLRRHLPDGIVYLNTGHSNLDARVFRALGRIAGAQGVALVHDVLPLDHPDLCRAGTADGFGRKMRAVARHADLVVHTTQHGVQTAERHFARLGGRVPPSVVAPLGADPVAPDQTHLPAGLPIERPYFLTLGTIEPRKNHALLLDIWEGFHARLPPEEIPRLFILGSRGWADAGLLRRLDALPFRGDTLFELPGLSDDAIAALMERTAGLLFPSLAEGFGLPPIEAALAGAPVVCNDLPVYRETLRDYPVYAPVGDSYLWAKTITDLAQGRRQPSARFESPGWDDHVNRVLSRISEADGGGTRPWRGAEWGSSRHTGCDWRASGG